MQGINPLQPRISMHILHTVLYTLPRVLTMGTCLTLYTQTIVNDILNTALCTFPVVMTSTNLFDNLELLKLVTFSTILITLTFDSRVIL